MWRKVPSQDHLRRSPANTLTEEASLQNSLKIIQRLKVPVADGRNVAKGTFSGSSETESSEHPDRRSIIAKQLAALVGRKGLGTNVCPPRFLSDLYKLTGQPQKRSVNRVTKRPEQLLMC
ncbi:unnamed protein product [Pleuronectes platessa]|uniref:Uncharacterized protein n=1 Tax=Pleuronectes platessa TaxID=8262 RepID=A0A9N7W065_PLEPL|nr:unnamed protein product [Pleuronectes platessa]